MEKLIEERPSVLRSSLVVMVGLGFSAATEVVKDSAIAYRYGASTEADAFFAAVAVPWVLATVIWSATNVSLVPIFTRLIDPESDAARSLAGKVAVILSCLVAVMALPLWLLAPGVMRLVAPGFGSSEAHLAAGMFRIVLPIVVLAAVGGTGLAYLNSRGQFLYPSLNNSLRNIVIVTLLLLPLGDHKPWLLAGSVLVGVAIQNLLVWPAASVSSGKKRRQVRWGDHVVRQALRRTLLPFAGLIVNNSITAIEQILATTLRSGSVALLNFGTRVPTGLGGIAGTAFSTGALPHFAQLASKDSRTPLIVSVRSTLRAVIVLGAPIMALLAGLSGSIARVLYQRGAFLGSDVEVVSSVMAAYAFTVLAVGLHAVLTSVLYAFQQVRTVAYILVSMRVISIGLAVLLVRAWGLLGLGLASAVSGYLSVIVLLLAVRPWVGSLLNWQVALFTSRIVVCALATWFCASKLDTWLTSVDGAHTLWHQLPTLAVSVLVGAGAFVALAWLLRVEEVTGPLHTCAVIARRRIARKC